MNADSKTIGRVAEIYAQAVFDVAVQAQLASVVDADLSTVNKMFADEKDLAQMMGSPYFTSEQKAALLQKVFWQSLSELAMNFLMVLVRHNRIKLLPRIMACYDRIWEDYKGYVSVRVTVAGQMEGNWIERLSEQIASAMKRKVSLETSIDPSIIGGIIIHYGNKVIDNAVRSRLVNTVRAVTGPEKRRVKYYEV